MYAPTNANGAEQQKLTLLDLKRKRYKFFMPPRVFLKKKILLEGKKKRKIINDTDCNVNG